MDTFMDKLAQKLTAQEMIKANSAADAAELSRTREQNAEYETLLKQIKESCVEKATAEQIESSAAQIEQSAAQVGNSAARIEQSTAQMESSAGKAEQNAARVEELLAAGIARIEEMQAGSRDTEELKELLTELKGLQSEQFTQLTDHVHKENIKVYRNVQAVVVDETAKQSEMSGKSLSAVSRKLTAVLGISIAALIAAVAGVVFQILVYLHIL